MYYLFLLIHVIIYIFFTNILFPGVAQYIFFIPSIIIIFTAFALYIIAIGAYEEFMGGLKVLLFPKRKYTNEKLKKINKFYKSLCLFGFIYTVSIFILHLLLSYIFQNKPDIYIAFTYIIYYVFCSIFIMYPVINKTSSYTEYIEEDTYG
jgi:hypothetical protein